MGIDWTSILNQILAVLVPTVIAALGILGSIVLNRLRAKLAASQALDDNALRMVSASQGIHKAEELSAQQVKAGNGPLTGPQKEVIATDVVQAASPGTVLSDAKTSVLAILGVTPGVGASVTPPLLEPDGRPLGWELTAEAKRAHDDAKAVGGSVS